MSQEIIEYSTIVIELCKAVKMHNFYPGGHPNLDTSLEKCFGLLKKALDTHGEIKWKVDQKGFYLVKSPLAQGNTDALALAKKLFFRRVKEITFTSRINLADMKSLLKLLRLEPEEVQKIGGPETFFAKERIEGILLNSLKYEDLDKLKNQIEEDRQKEELNQAKQEEQKPTETGEAEKTPEEAQPEEEKKADENTTLPELLKLIEKETDFLVYTDLAVRISEKAASAMRDKKYDEALPAILVFSEHSDPASNVRTDDFKGAAKERLTSCLNSDMIRYAAGRIGNKEEPFRLQLQRLMLNYGGSEGIDILLDAVIEAPEAIARRYFYNTLVLFGNSIRKNVEARLSGEWYVIRQMVSLLGDIGDPLSLGALEKSYEHPDARVKKEVLKSLIKMPSQRSSMILQSALDEKDETLVKQAIISLATMKDVTAIDSVAKIAVKRDPFNEASETVKEAIKALGIIGDDKGTPYLISILNRTVWVGKKANEESRMLAAISLSMIGSREAYDAIEKAASKATDDLQVTCKRILEAWEK